MLKKHAVLVVGPGRCGTSCMMGILRIMGIPIGDRFSEPYVGNEKGEFEHLDMRNINYEITKAITGDTSVYGFYKGLGEADLTEFKQKIRNGILQFFGSYHCFAFKDPRVTFLLPLYVEVLTEMQYQVKCIFMHRDSGEMVKSFEHGIKGLEKFSWVSHEVIEEYVKRGVQEMTSFKDKKQSQLCQYIHFDYEQILEDTDDCISKLTKFLSTCSFDRKDDDKCKQEIKIFIDKSLKHF